ncbi:hypothetical protein BO70DRAFT_424086 [Aspergillus heteromorphus CBS 117.55]|uniref:Uncharacterized protein n=1 Tax=Aspergillus heteromorphus CBS 117.55 TaxID=1448321 RepID=A0A317WEM6_9EURO|nr:uncharacterized protein BO70DRAFT_424086 [Aspergillus heteromorphus CBS 117.55]PWY84884.1 hypothetical protein BO70DRAFT_424086 [Aspergillus heteromorphus CBS 117.55]
MPRIQRRPTNLRIMRIHTPQHNGIPDPFTNLPHGGGKKPRARPEPLPGPVYTSRVIGALDDAIHEADLRFQDPGGEILGGLVAEGVVGEFHSVGEEGGEQRGGGGGLGLRADEEEGGAGVVGEERGEDGGRVWRGRVVEGQRDGVLERRGEGRWEGHVPDCGRVEVLQVGD